MISECHYLFYVLLRSISFFVSRLLQWSIVTIVIVFFFMLFFRLPILILLQRVNTRAYRSVAAAGKKRSGTIRGRYLWSRVRKQLRVFGKKWVVDIYCRFQYGVCYSWSGVDKLYLCQSCVFAPQCTVYAWYHNANLIGFMKFQNRGNIITHTRVCVQVRRRWFELQRGTGFRGI